MLTFFLLSTVALKIGGLLVEGTEYLESVTTPINGDFTLIKNDRILSKTEYPRTELIFGNDGNFVLQTDPPQEVLWKTNTNGINAAYVRINYTGNIEIHTNDNVVVWESHTAEHSATQPHTLHVIDGCVYLVNNISTILWNEGNQCGTVYTAATPAPSETQATTAIFTALPISDTTIAAHSTSITPINAISSTLDAVEHPSDAPIDLTESMTTPVNAVSSTLEAVPHTSKAPIDLTKSMTTPIAEIVIMTLTNGRGGAVTDFPKDDKANHSASSSMLVLWIAGSIALFCICCCCVILIWKTVTQKTWDPEPHVTAGDNDQVHRNNVSYLDEIENESEQKEDDKDIVQLQRVFFKGAHVSDTDKCTTAGEQTGTGQIQQKEVVLDEVEGKGSEGEQGKAHNTQTNEATHN